MYICFRLWDGPTVLLAPAGHSFASYMRHEPPSLSGLGGGREFSSGYGSGGGEGQAAKEEGKQGQVPVLILHGSEDKTVDVDLSYQVSANWQADTTLCFLSGCPEPVLAYAQGFDQKYRAKTVVVAPPPPHKAVMCCSLRVLGSWRARTLATAAGC